MYRIRLFSACALVILFGCTSAGSSVAPASHSTLQQAIDAAEPGETVPVKAGVYEECLTFKAGINLVGEGRDKVTIRCDAKSGPVLSVTDCREGSISGLTLEHSGAEDLAGKEEGRPDVLSLNSSSVEVIGCAVRGSGGDGIGIAGKGIPKIRDCTVQGNSGNGIGVTGEGAAPTLENNQCIENKASGIHFGEGARGTAKGNTCSRNEMHGIAVEDEETRATLRNNRCSENKRSGIFFGDGTGGTVQNCIITDNGEINEGEIARLLESEQFDTLESIASELRAKKSRFPSGVWQLKAFYAYLMDGSEGINFKKKEQFLEMLQRWHEAHPGSVTPRILLADAHTEYAWEARGHGWASTVTEDGWKGFREHLTKAWEILREAEKLETKDPQLYSIMVLTGMGLSKDRPDALASFLSDVTGLNLTRNEIAEAFEKGTQVEPAYYHTYYRRAISLLPRWGGGPGEVERFAARAVELTRDIEGEALYPVVAYHVLDFVGTATYCHRFHFSWPRIKQGHIDLLKRFPESAYRLNAFCLFASIYKDRETARELFEKIGDNWYRSVWSRGAFERWKEWADGRIDWPGPQPLHYSANLGYVALTDKLLRDGEDVNARDPSGWTPLYYAVYRDEIDIVKLLLANRADVNTATNRDFTPLYAAAYDGDVEIVKLLTALGADVNLATDLGWTSLYAAVHGGHLETAKLLIEHGADVNLATRHSMTPLYAAVRANMREMIELLIENGADVNIATDTSWSPLIRACRDGNGEVVRLLLRNGGEVNVATDIGWSPLMLACDTGNREFAEAFLRSGAHVNTTMQDGWAALHLAARKGHTEIVGMLLGQQGIDINIANEELETPLHESAERGHEQVVRLLLEKGAEVNPRDEDGLTPLGLAKRRRRASIVELLRKHGGVE